MSNGSDKPNSTPDKPVTPQFPTESTELNDIKPTIPQFPADRIEKGEKSGDINKKDS